MASNLKGYGTPVLVKTHIAGYTRQDGTVVRPHEDSRHQRYAELFTPSLGIRRDSMPQVPGPLKQKFIDGLRSRGVSVDILDVDPGGLLPTQSTFNAKNMDFLTEEARAGRVESTPILVSNCGRVIDGHHRWAVALLEGHPLKVARVDLGIRAALEAAKEFSSANGVEARTASGPATAKVPAKPVLVKAHVGAYLRGGKLVNLKGYQGKTARAQPVGDQLALFARPQSSMRMDVNPYKGKDPILDTPDLFTGETQRERPTRTPEAPDELIREHRRLVAVLRSPSRTDDLEEAGRQEAELREYEQAARRARG